MAFQGESRHSAAPRYHPDAMTAMTNSEHEPARTQWPRGTLRLYPLLCELSWVFNIGDAPPSAAERIDEVPTQDSETRSALGPLGPEPLSGLEPQVRHLLSRVEVPRELMRVAVHRFVTFRREFEALSLAHRDACLRAFEATRVDSAAALPPQPRGLPDFIDDLRHALARWKLAGTSGPSPILGPFAAALIRGVRAGSKRPSPSVPGLRIVPDVDSGDMLQILAYGHRADRGDRSLASAESLGLNPSPTGRGRLVNQPQLIDAQLWTLRHIGLVPVQELASWQGVNRQQIGRVLGHVDRALENGLPRPRPGAVDNRSYRRP